MSKNMKGFLTDMNMDYDTYKQIAGISTRARMPLNKQSPPVEKAEDKKKASKKDAYVPPQCFQATASTAMDATTFKGIVQDLLKRLKAADGQAYMHLDALYTIYQDATSKGGVVQVSSVGGFSSLMRNCLIAIDQDHVYEQINPSFVQKIRQLLFTVQFLNRNTLVPIKLYELGLVNFVSKEELRQHVKDRVWGLNYFNYDLTLFQEGAQAIQIDKEIFNLDYMCTHYSKQKIDIRIQNPLDYGFKPSKLKNKKYQMTLGEYRFYQLNFLDISKMKLFKHTQQLGKGQVFFGVNFEPSDQMLNKQIKKNVEDTFLDYHGDFDLLSYMDVDVPGCSLPQMYFKTPGCWTGGHQQNICMSAMNINHGPDYSEWFTLDLCYIEKLRNELLQNYNTDLYLSEGLWYEKLDWFIERGYPVKRFLQRKDDIVVTGPGTLHWVRSFGVALQTSWNIFPKNFEQFKAAFARHKINKQIKFPKSDTIPLKQLIMEYLNHERVKMPEKNRILCVNQLEEWLQMEQQVVYRLAPKIKKKQRFYLQNLQSFCSICRQEVLVYFLPAPVEMKRGISCVECFQKWHKQTKNSIIEEMYFKFDIFYIEMLIQLCKNGQANQSRPGEILELCQGKHIGELSVKCKMQPAEDKKLLAGNFIFNDIQEVVNAERQIFFNDSRKLQLYENVLKGVQSNKNRGKSKSKEKRRMANYNKMFSAESEMMDQKQVKEVEKVDTHCQTDMIDQKEQGQVSQKQKQKQKQKSSSQSASKKKKKKHKSKSKKKDKKKKKSKQSQPRFKTSSDEQRKVGSQDNEPNFRNKPNNQRYDENNFEGDGRRNDNGGNRMYADNGNQRGGRDNTRNENRNDDWGNNRNDDRGNSRNDRFGRNNDRNDNWNDRNDNRNDNRGQFQNDSRGGSRNENYGGGRDRQWNNNNNGDDNRNDNNDGGDRGDDRGRGRGWGNRNNNNNFRNDRNDRYNNNNNDNNGNDECEGQNGRRRNFNDRGNFQGDRNFNNNNNGGDDNRDRNFNNEGGRGRGDWNRDDGGGRGRGGFRGGRGRGRGGFSRDNDFRSQRNNDNFNNQNNEGEGATSNEPKCDAPDQY